MLHNAPLTGDVLFICIR